MMSLFDTWKKWIEMEPEVRELGIIGERLKWAEVRFLSPTKAAKLLYSERFPQVEGFPPQRDFMKWLLCYLSEQTPEYLREVMVSLGLPDLPYEPVLYSSFFFWFSQTSSAPVPNPEVRKYLCGLSISELKSFHPYMDFPIIYAEEFAREGLLFWALTKSINGISCEGPGYQEGFDLSFEHLLRYSPSTVLRSALYTHYPGKKNDRSDSSFPSPAPYQTLFTYGWNEVDAYLQEWVPDCPIEREILEEDLPRDLANLIQSYLGGNVEKLARTLGMVFPPHLQTLWEKEDYFLTELRFYEQVVNRGEIPPLQEHTRKSLLPYTDLELIEVFGVPSKWHSRADFLLQCRPKTTAISEEDPEDEP